MTTMPREVARKQPANSPVPRQRAKVIEGRTKPQRSRGDLAGRVLLQIIAYLFLAAGLAGYLLASMQQH